MMEKAGFDPTHPAARKPLARLRAFHDVVSRQSGVTFPTLVMNDGAVAYAAASPTTPDPVWRFVQRVWQLYQAATIVDAKEGGPGLRAVIAVGLRAKGRRDGIDAQEAAFAELIDQVATAQMTVAQAKKASRSIRRSFDVVPTLQANFAFARAYLAETGGSKAGLPGPNLYLDAKVFRHGVPDWIEADPPVVWSPDKRPSLSTHFVAVHGFRLVDRAAEHFRTGRELYDVLRHAAS